MTTESSTLISKLQTLEKLSRLLEPDSRQWEDWFAHFQKLSQEFLDDLPQAPASKSYEPRPSENISHSLLGSDAIGFQASADEMFSRVLKSGIDTAGSRYFAYIPGGGITTGAFADFFASLTNRYAGMFLASPGAVTLENEVIEAFIELFGFPKTSWGTLTSCGSVANLTAILAARESRPRKEWDQSTIYMTEHCHSSGYRAIRIAGLDPKLIRKVPVDSNLRMDPVALREQIHLDISLGMKPWIIFGSLGTTNTGNVDPVLELLRIKNEFNLWLHLDAAYGGFFILTENGKKLFQGAEHADSIVLDPHKSLFMPYGCGAVLVKDAQLLKQAFAADSVYLSDLDNPSERSPADYSIELTRHFRAPRIYLSLKTFGIAPFKAALEEKLLLTQYAYQELQNFSPIELACEPELSVIAFRIKGEGDEDTKNLLGQIIQNGRVHMSSTRINGKMYLRICILSFRSHLDEVKLCLDEIRNEVRNML